MATSKTPKRTKVGSGSEKTESVPAQSSANEAVAKGASAQATAARPKAKMASGKSTAKKAASKPATRKAASKVVAQKPAARKVAARNAVAQQPAVKKSVAKKPAARKPAAGKAAVGASGQPPAMGSGAAARVAQQRAAAPAAMPEIINEMTAAIGKAPIWLDPAQMARLQNEYLERLQNLFKPGKPELKDPRFADPSWQGNDLYAWNAALYGLNSEFLLKMSQALEGDAKARERVQFATQQMVEALSPANFLATNPSAQQKLIETKGESLRAGIENLFGDMQKGRISQSDESAFEVGRNVATTPGSVVFENDLIQIIQYAPTTGTVGARPMLMIPPAINKFYVLDLQPSNSVVAGLVDQGHTVFMVSWRNVGEAQQTLTWDDYLVQGPIAAIRVVREISGQDQINVLGFCVGGTILATALAALDAHGERPVASLTLLTTLLDFDDPGVVNVFIDEQHVAWREATMGAGGIMSGKDLNATFSMLRARDLVWNYVEKNYLKGEQPPAFDLLYWNADSTNLPGPMYCWYLRHLYLQNELRIPGALECTGVPIDLGAIDVPSYIYGSREDHIVPWKSAYASTGLLAGDVRFILGASGHLAGVINPPAKNRRNYWVADQIYPEADQWLAAAREVPGSWWPDWFSWLESYRGEMIAAPQRPGSDKYRAIEPAPGRYVKERLD